MLGTAKTLERTASGGTKNNVRFYLEDVGSAVDSPYMAGWRYPLNGELAFTDGCRFRCTFGISKSSRWTLGGRRQFHAKQRQD